MRIKLLFLFAIFSQFHQFSFAQTSGFVYSSISRPVQNKQDSLLLIQNEQKMWKAASQGKVLMFDNPMMDCEFKVKMSKMAVEWCFKDSIPMKSGASQYMMNLMQNRNADTCYIMSFSPFLTHRFQQRYWAEDSVQPAMPDTVTIGNRIAYKAGHWETGPWQTGFSVKFLMPLSEYPAVIPQKDLMNVNAIYRRQYASLLGGKLSGDTIYRTVRFTRDSNEYLPQAPYANLLLTLKAASLSGLLRPYKSNDLSSPMSKFYMETMYVSWDSTNQVEDPNNPGTFILAPLKTEGQVQSLLICEKWIPFQSMPTAGRYEWVPKPHLSYRRVVTAYGLLITSGNIIWFSPADVNNVLAKWNFNMIPYEECFRAERFKTLQVQVHTW
jgi:hypothetical protein